MIHIDVSIGVSLSHISMIPFPSFENPPMTIFVSFVTRALTFSSAIPFFLHSSLMFLSRSLVSLFILHCAIEPRRVDVVRISGLEKDL